MPKKPSIIELLDRNSPNSVQIETALTASSWREEEGETYVDILVCNGTTIPRWGAYDGDEWIGDFDQMMVLDGNHNVDDTRLKNGVNLIDSHDTYTAEKTYGISTAWWVKDGALYATFRLSPIAFASKVADCIKNGTIKYVSVGAFVLKASWDKTGDKPLRTITLMQPYEVSLVIVPAIAEAMVLSMDPKLKEKFMSEVTKPGIAPAPATTTVPAVVQQTATPPAPVEQTAEQLAASIASEVGLQVVAQRTVLDAKDPKVATILSAAQILGPSVLKAAEDARLGGKTIEQMHEAMKAAAKARVDAIVKFDAQNAISGDLPMPVQKTEQQQASKPKATSLFSMPALRARMRAGEKV